MIRYIDERELGREESVAEAGRERLDRLDITPVRELRDQVRRDIGKQVLRDTLGGGRRKRGRALAQWGRHRLAADSVEVLRTAGIFGTVKLSDLTELFDSAGRARRSLRELERDGLVRVERFQRGSRRIDAVSLSSRGRRLLERSIDPRERGDEEPRTCPAPRVPHRSCTTQRSTGRRGAKCSASRLRAGKCGAFVRNASCAASPCAAWTLAGAAAKTTGKLARRPPASYSSRSLMENCRFPTCASNGSVPLGAARRASWTSRSLPRITGRAVCQRRRWPATRSTGWRRTGE